MDRRRSPKRRQFVAFLIDFERSIFLASPFFFDFENKRRGKRLGVTGRQSQNIIAQITIRRLARRFIKMQIAAHRRHHLAGACIVRLIDSQITRTAKEFANAVLAHRRVTKPRLQTLWRVSEGNDGAQRFGVELSTAFALEWPFLREHIAVDDAGFAVNACRCALRRRCSQ